MGIKSWAKVTITNLNSLTKTVFDQRTLDCIWCFISKIYEHTVGEVETTFVPLFWGYTWLSSGITYASTQGNISCTGRIEPGSAVVHRDHLIHWTISPGQNWNILLLLVLHFILVILLIILLRYLGFYHLPLWETTDHNSSFNTYTDRSGRRNNKF